MACLLKMLAGCLGLITLTASAQDSLRTTRPKKQFIPLPIVYYTPETHVGYGVLGACLFQAGANARTSNIDFAAIYTQNHQLVLDPTLTIFTRNERYLIKANLLYTQFPEFYYGIGNDTRPINRELIAYSSFRTYAKVLRQVKPGWFVGVQQQFFSTFNVRRSSTTPHPVNTLVGELGSRTNGLGLSSIVDTRDNIYSATRGWYAEVSGLAYRPLFGSQYTFTNYLLDLRHYQSLTPKTVVAWQVFLNLNTGTVPFKQAATLGGSMLMRGYYNGRYRDNHALILQAELRQRLVGRLGGAVFVATGDVAHQLSEFSVGDLKLTGGAGLRWLLSRQEHVNLRVDVAFGRHTQGLYFNISEAF